MFPCEVSTSVSSPRLRVISRPSSISVLVSVSTSRDRVISTVVSNVGSCPTNPMNTCTLAYDGFGSAIVELKNSSGPIISAFASELDGVISTSPYMMTGPLVDAAAYCDDGWSVISPDSTSGALLTAFAADGVGCARDELRCIDGDTELVLDMRLVGDISIEPWMMVGCAVVVTTTLADGWMVREPFTTVGPDLDVLVLDALGLTDIEPLTIVGATTIALAVDGDVIIPPPISIDGLTELALDDAGCGDTCRFPTTTDGF